MVKFFVMTCVLVGGLGAGALAFAQHAVPEPVAVPVATNHALPAAAPVAQAIKPGDRSCLQQTGSLIPAKKGACLPVAGRSYSADDLRRTGAPSTGRALQMLDPSLSVGR